MSLDFFRIHKGLNLTPQSSAPSSPAEGDLYFDSTLVKLRVYQNGGWVNITDSDGTVLLSDGSAASPSLSFISDTDTGLYLSGTNILNFSTNGTERGSISATGAWVLGSTNSSQTHTINGDILDINTSGDASFQFNNSGTNISTIVNNGTQTGNSALILAVSNTVGTDPYIRFTLTGLDSWSLGIDNSDSDAFVFSNSSSPGTTNRFRVAGNSFQLNLGSDASPSYSFIGDTDTGIYSSGANTLNFTTAGTSAGNISSTSLWTIGPSGSTQTHVVNGDLGITRRLSIGTATPTSVAMCYVGGNTLTSTTQIFYYLNATGNSNATTAIKGAIFDTQTAAASFSTALVAAIDSGVTVNSGATATRATIFDASRGISGAGTITNKAVFADNQSYSGNYFINSTNTDESLISGDLRINTAGKGLLVKEGSNAKMGVSTLVAGTVTVNTTAVTANSRIFLTHQNNSGTIGFVTVSARTASTSFTITSSNASDTSNIAWIIVEPA